MNKKTTAEQGRYPASSWWRQPYQPNVFFVISDGSILGLLDSSKTNYFRNEDFLKVLYQPAAYKPYLQPTGMAAHVWPALPYRYHFVYSVLLE